MATENISTFNTGKFQANNLMNNQFDDDDDSPFESEETPHNTGEELEVDINFVPACD
jgi:hypothetical protein